MLPDAEMSRILGVTVAGARDDSASATQCTYQPKGGSTPYVELKITWGDGEVAMASVGFLGRLEPGLAAAYAGVGDEAMVVGPAVMVRTGEDLVTLTFSGVDDVPGTARRIIDSVRPRMGPSSQRGAAANADRRAAPGGIPAEARDILEGLPGALKKQDSTAGKTAPAGPDAGGTGGRGRVATEHEQRTDVCAGDGPGAAHSSRQGTDGRRRYQRSPPR